MKKRANVILAVFLVLAAFSIGILGKCILEQEKNNSEVTGWNWRIESCWEVRAPSAAGEPLKMVAKHFMLSHPGEENMTYILTPRHPEWETLRSKGSGDFLWLNTAKNKEIILATSGR